MTGYTVKGSCNDCGQALPVTGTQAELVAGVPTTCACGRKYKVGWRHELRGDHGGVVQVALP